MFIGVCSFFLICNKIDLWDLIPRDHPLKEREQEGDMKRKETKRQRKLQEVESETKRKTKDKK